MDIYEQLKFLIASPNSTEEEKKAADILYRLLIRRRDMSSFDSPKV